MTTEKLFAKACLFYVLSMLFGICISWKYCGVELMCVSFYYLVRATWNELKGMWNELKIMR